MNDIQSIISAIMTFIGVIFVAISLSKALKLKPDLPEDLQKKWQIVIMIMTAFVLGYLLFVGLFIAAFAIPYNIVLGFLFMVGAIFLNLIIFFIRATSQSVEHESQQQFTEEIKKKNTDLEKKIAELKQAEEQLTHQSLHDELTGLPNRVLLIDRLQQAINVGKREHRTIAIIMVNLDSFREINDTLGHEIGDIVLKIAVERIRSILRDSDTIARFSGDEFAVIMPTIDEKHINIAAYKILGVFEKTFDIDSTSLDVRASLGITIFPHHGSEPITLIQRADVAMNFAKKGKTGFAVYSSELDKNSVEQLALISELKNAISNDELVLYFQPKIDIKTGHIKSVEALVRWVHPTRGFMPPDAFIGLAEQTGIIRNLTLWVLKTALKQQAAWKARGINLNVAVNLSAKNLQDKHFPHIVEELLDEIGVEPENVILEITESAIMDDQARAMDVLTRLDAMNIVLSIDDFGTGYSSLAYLKSLPVDELKIDKSFVMELASDENDQAIVRSTIDLAHNLGLVVIAEGVETEDVWNKLKDLGCDMGQGFYMGRPLPPAELDKWLNESPFGIAKT